PGEPRGRGHPYYHRKRCHADRRSAGYDLCVDHRFEGLDSTMKPLRTYAILFGLAVLLLSPVAAVDLAPFKAGFATVDVTPQAPVPLWGYGLSNRAENVS